MERVGVVVIHGVGENNEGWIDQYLVANLQRWVAYNNAGRAPDAKADPDMVVVVATGDFKQLAIALDTDAHMQAFLSLTGKPTGLTKAEFATPDRRKRNRDAFIDAVMNVVATQPAAVWLEHLAKAGIPATLAFDPTSSVYRVRDPESGDPMRTWKAFQRVWTLPEREVRFTELYWADMSDVGKTIGARMLAVFELANEAPYYLGRALLRDSTRDIHAVIGALIRSANWLMRWPVAGLNAAVFLAAFCAIFFMNSGPRLATFIAGILVLAAVGGIAVCRWLLHSRPGLADMALSTGLLALPLLVLLGVAAVVTHGALPEAPDSYLVVSILVLLIAWTLWTVPILAAIALMALVAFKRIFVRRRLASPPLARPAAAIGLNIVLAMLLKFLYAAFGILVITTLVGARANGSTGACSTTTQSSTQLWTLSDVFASASPPCQLDMLKRLLLDISAFNGIGLALLLTTVLALSTARRVLLRLFARAAVAGHLRLPRLIAHPAILLILIAGVVLNAALVYFPGVAEMRLPSLFLGALRGSGVEHLGASALILLVIGLAVVVELSDSFLHIGRDLVDHQYDRAPRSAAMRVSGERQQDKTSQRYRRRVRIQRRLEELIDSVIRYQQANRLIFLAHSQGTVILRDYLFDHDRLMEDRRRQTANLADLACVDVVTLGSPLTHIYRHYFADDDRSLAPDDAGGKPVDKVRSWTNLWRVDDPIGQAVDLAPITQVENRGIGPGGHTEYWKEAPVCELIWTLVCKPLDGQSRQSQDSPLSKPSA